MLRCRVDDFPGTKPEEFWRHNIDNFKRFNAVMEKHQLEYVLGVIPRHTTDEQLQILSEMPLVEVALHGVRHDERYLDEFHFETEKEITELLRSAKQPLNDICGPVVSYIPPHNVISYKTIGPLVQTGFKHLHTGPGSGADSTAIARARGMQIRESFPPLLYGRSDELMMQGAAKKIRESGFVNDGLYESWLTLHWTWEWNIGLDFLDRFLTEIGPVTYSRRTA